MVSHSDVDEHEVVLAQHANHDDVTNTGPMALTKHHQLQQQEQEVEEMVVTDEEAMTEDNMAAAVLENQQATSAAMTSAIDEPPIPEVIHEEEVMHECHLQVRSCDALFQRHNSR